jgi:uncharacterized protein DUF695
MMNFLKKLLGKKEEINVTDNTSFWNWFMLHEKSFYNAIKSGHNVDDDFLNILMPKLQQVNDRFFCSTGMYSDETAELVITAEGDIKSFVFVEELIAAAPPVSRWKFTALNPPIGLNDTNIKMDGLSFDKNNLSFIDNGTEEHPDEIELIMIHSDYNEENKHIITNGTLIYLDHLLGELNAATLIDNIRVAGNSPTNKPLISIEKLIAFLQWREKEFVEKYSGTRHNTEDDNYSTFEAEDEEGLLILAIINQELLDWDAKASHPWMMIFEIKYDIEAGGMPYESVYTLMDQFENELVQRLPDSDGYLNLGRKTYNGTRTIYFACKEFRHSSKMASLLIHEYSKDLDISYDIYKDKYWMTMREFE